MMERATHTIDASGKVLGRLATEIAVMLRGKNKVGFTFHQDHGDKVVVTNAEKIVVTGRKAEQKNYYRHSGHPGGLKTVGYKTMREKHPERIIMLAVKTMLPANRLRNNWLKRLEVKRGDA
ncbi:MAG: 50S ribosomal protein L13 [Patescibacteria group bacterium]